MVDAPSREAIGSNIPPLDPPETIAARLEQEHAELFQEAALLESAAFQLPEDPGTDDEASQVSDFVVRVKGVVKRLEDARTTAGRPYLDGTKAINTLFADFTGPLLEKRTGLADRLTERVRIYNAAKAERERSERLERERVEREKAEAARAEERRQREEADRLALEAEQAAARLRNAADAEARKKAEIEMRERTKAAGEARAAANASGKEASQAERKADTNLRATTGDTRELSRVSAGGSTSSITKRWSYTIADSRRLRESAGVLGPFLSDDTLEAAVSRAVREQSQGGGTPTIKIPGVDIHQVDQANIRAAR